MPIYKTGGKKDGLQKYIVRINYINSYGQAKQLSRIAYGLESAKDLEIELSQKNKEATPIEEIIVRKLFDEYIAIKRMDIRESSVVKLVYNFNRYILPTFENCMLDRITPKMLQDWKLSIGNMRISLTTKKSAFIEFKAMINYAHKMEYIERNPFDKVQNFKDTSYIKPEMKFYTHNEFTKYISTAKEIAISREKEFMDLTEWDYYVFFNIAFYTGLRKGEIHALKWTDADNAFLFVRRSLTQKYGHDIETAPKTKSSIRRLQMPLPLIEVLQEQKARQQQLHNFTDDFRICNNIRDTSIDRKNIMYANRAEVRRIRIHDFRHSHVSVLANEGVNIQEIARRLGHSRIEMTWNTYCHLYPREEERAVAVLNSLR